MAESVMIRLAEHTGRQEAHSIVRECSIAAHESGAHLLDVLLEREEVTAHLDADEIAAAMDPYQYIGTAVEQVEAVVVRLRTRA
jgi:adenylosuccinate lyase